MDLAKDILDVAEKVGPAPGLTIASSIITSILKAVETSTSNTARLRTLAHALAGQLIDISENMKGKWDDAPLTLKRAIDEYDAFVDDFVSSLVSFDSVFRFLLEMLKSITRLSRYSRLRAFLLAGECEREITRLEKLVADVRSTISLTIGMNLSIAVNQVQTSLASYGHVGHEMHFNTQQLVDDARSLDLRPGSCQTTPDFSLFTREDFQITRTIFRQATDDQERRDVMTVSIHRAERSSNGRAILVKTFEGDDTLRVRSQFSKELDMFKKALNPAVLQLIGWSSAAAQIPFHVYHSPEGVIEPFFSWARRTLRSNPVETIFGLYDMRESIKELVEFKRNRHVGFNNLFGDGVVNIQRRGDCLRFALIHAGRIYEDEPEVSYNKYSGGGYYEYNALISPESFENDESVSDIRPAATIASMFARAAKEWFGDPHGIEALFKARYDTINPRDLGPVLLEARWLSTANMYLKFQGSMRLGDVGYMAPDGHFKVVTNLHTKLVSHTGGLPEWAYKKSRVNRADPEDAHVVVAHADTLYRRYKHVLTRRKLSLATWHWVVYTDLDEGHAWKTLQQEAHLIIEDNCLSIAPHELQLLTSIAFYPLLIIIKEPTGQEDFPPDSATITVYEFQQEGLLSELASGAPQLNTQVFYSFQENIDGLDPYSIQQHPETGDILVNEDRERPFEVEYLQLPIGVTHLPGIEENPAY